MKSLCAGWGLLCCAILASGCGGGSNPNAAATGGSAGEGAVEVADNGAENGLPTTAIAAPPAQPEEPLSGFGFQEEEGTTEEAPADVGEPIEGSPEWNLREITKITIAPLPQTTDPDEITAARTERWTKVIELARGTIAQTHKDKEKAQLFSVAVRHMLAARMELALQGDRAAVDALYDDAASLWERDKDSKEAMEAAFTLAQLAYTSARNTTSGDTKWLQEYVRQATQYAKNFPKDTPRSVPMLFNAANLCEQRGFKKPALKTYTQIQEQYPDSPYARQIVGVMRRLNLDGQPVQLAGPSLEEGQIAIEDFAGSPVVVVFWTSASPTFPQELEALQKLQRRAAKTSLKFLGVCVDSDVVQVKSFIAERKISWPQILFTEPAQQGWNNPIATYYGLIEPTIWVVDQEGKVVTTTAKATELEQHILPLLKGGARRQPEAAAE
jgi:peroxiredoxin